MWESFNASAIEQELTWAENIGFSKLRVFLHVAPFQAHFS
jgi:endo-1,4-beta-mannosidase